jgi:hypothetical protein
MGVPVKAEIRPLEPDPGNAGGGSKKNNTLHSIIPLKKGGERWKRSYLLALLILIKRN